jgi:predicted metal-dependent hydrolase
MLDRLSSIFSNSRSDPLIDIEGEAVPLRIRRNGQAKRVSLRVDAVKREIKATIPTWAPTAAAVDFATKKRQLIASRLESILRADPLSDGGSVGFLGEEHRIVWCAGATRTVRRLVGDNGWELRLGGPVELVEARIVRWLKAEARELFVDELAHYCGLAGEPVPKLSLGDPRGRWGSYSSRGTISLSWRLVMAPDHVRRSVIAHEVAHMRHMNHSPAFYAWLDSFYEGDRKVADRWLKMHGSALQGVGRG